MELKRYITFLRQWLWLMAICGVIGGVLAFVVSSQQQRVYASSTKVLVNQARAGISNTPTIDDMRARDRLATTYAELLKRRPLLEAVVTNLGLAMRPGDLYSALAISIVPETEIIVVTAQDPDARQAAAIANEVVRAFNQQAPTLFNNPYAASVPVLNIVEEARPNFNAVRPATQNNVAMGAFIGIFLAIGIGFLFNYFDDRVKSSSEVEALTGFSTLLAVAPMRGRSPYERLVTVSDPRSTHAEAYQNFLAHIDLFSERDPIKTLIVTSGASREGKSTTAANLAVVVARMGRKVILIDADLRAPTIHAFFRQRNEAGLTAALDRPAGQPARDFLAPTEIENLRVLTSGTPSARPVQLLGSPQMAALLDELKAEADLVIFDSPAMLPIVDAMLLTRLADAAILVVRANQTRAEALSRASELLAQSGVRILGAVLTGVATPHGSYTTYHSASGWRQKRYAGWKNSLFALRRAERPAEPAPLRPEQPEQAEPKRRRS